MLIRSTLVALGAVIAMMVGTAAPGESTLYVDDSAPLGGDGLSWDTAYRFLQDALAVAEGGGVGEIRVGQGIYKPDQDEAGNVTPGDREASFNLISGVALMGGYAGFGAMDPNERDVELFETVLSGDLLGDDGDDFADNGDNSLHVVTGNAAIDAVLDGLTVTAGNADDFGFDSTGGGLQLGSCDITISACSIVANAAQNHGAGLSLTMCDALIDGCTFRGNRWFGVGGGSGGGGIWNQDCPRLTVIDCVFEDNFGRTGGAVANGFFVGEPDSTVAFIGCSMIGNSAQIAGGAAHNQDYAAIYVNCRISDNHVIDETLSLGGGMINLLETRLLMINVEMSGNSAIEGGGLANNEPSTFTIVGCTFAGNTALDTGGGIRVAGNESFGDLDNSILWANSDAGGMDESAQIDVGEASVTIGYCDVQGLTGALGGIGNIDADPLFVDPDNGDFRLQAGSPCIDAGHNWAVAPDFVDLDSDDDTAELTPFDLDGNPRFVHAPAQHPGCGEPAIVDMGASEFQKGGKPAEIILGDIDGDGTVGQVDLVSVMFDWGPCEAGCCMSDLDMDGMVGITDLLIVLRNWG